MNYQKRILAVLLLFSILAGCAGRREISLRAATISKETEWNIRCLKAEKSYEESKSLPKIRVAVLDSGLDTDRNIPFIKRKDFLGESELHSLYQDQTGHGTSVAGLICADENDDRITGIAANVDLYVGRILDAANQAPIDRVVEAVEWAIEEKVNIIHISFGTKYESEELEEVIQKAYNQGILIIAAAGNDGNAAEDESTIEYPAAYEEVVSVGATDPDNAVLDSSSTGEELDVVAPGSQILSTGAFGGVVVDSGTSISAAQVTGIAAVLWGKHPEKSNVFIRGLLVGSANADAVSGDCGEGLVDYSRSVENYKQMNSTYETYKRKGLSERAAVSRAEQELPENAAFVASHKGEINYVNGLWEWNTHDGFMDQTQGFSQADIQLIKLGATVPDVKTLPQMAKMGAHPCFHGSGNYFANVSYLLAYAKQLVHQEKEELPGFRNFFVNSKYFDYLTKIKRNNIETELTNCKDAFYRECASRASGQLQGQPLSTRQKGYVILGLALHTITDTFAHMGYRKDRYSGNFYPIVHNRVEDTSGEWKDSVTQIWNEIVNSKNSSAYDKTYYQYMLTYFACADNAEQMRIRTLLSEKTAKELIAALNGTDDFLDQMASILEDFQNENPEDMGDVMNGPSNYRLANVNKNWTAVKSNAKSFGINMDVNESSLGNLKKSDIRAVVKNKKLTISFPHKKDYTYQIYYDKGNKKVFFTRKGKKYTTKTKGMKGNVVHIVSFYNSHQVKKHYEIEYKVTYIYKKKRKTQTIKYNPKKLSFKLYGNIFKLKGKSFKGWSKKKNAKKAVYKSKKKMKFTGSEKLKLYCVKK